MSIVIKKMETEKEIRGKAFVVWQSWRETYPGLISQAYLDSLTLEMCEDAAFRWPDHVMIAKDEGRVVGFVRCGGMGAEAPDTGEIIALYVLSGYHGKGIGRQLMAAGLEQLKEYPRICLWTLKENKRAIRFYRKCGFCPDGREKYSSRLEASEIGMTLKRCCPDQMK